MDQSSAAAGAAGGLHMTKDPVSISNPDIITDVGIIIHTI